MDLHRHRLSIVSLSTVIVLLASGGGVAAAASSPAPITANTLTNTGVADTGPATYVPPTSAAAGVAAKLRLLADMRSDHTAVSNGGSSQVIPNVITYPTYWNLSGVIDHYESEGNYCTANATGCYWNGSNWMHSYTCGPASTRNLVQMLTGTNNPEATYQSWEGTTTDGTSISAIASTLNTHYGNWESWSVYHPTSASDLWNNMAIDLYSYITSVVQNVNTYYLDYFNGASLAHFNTVYGWASYSTLNIDEEWNTTMVFGSSAWYGNPWGLHTEDLNLDYAAVSNSISTDIVF